MFNDLKIGDLTVEQFLQLKQKDYPEIYGVTTFAEVAEITKSTAYKLIHRREVPHFKRPGSSKVYFRHKEVIEWMTQCRVPTITEMTESAMV